MSIHNKEETEAAWRAGYEVGHRHATQDGAVRQIFTASSEEFGEAALRGETHKREIAKLKLESDRRARRVAERMLALCKAEVIGYPDISDTQMSGLRWAMDGINIEALVDESKL